MGEGASWLVDYGVVGERSGGRAWTIWAQSVTCMASVTTHLSLSSGLLLLRGEKLATPNIHPYSAYAALDVTVEVSCGLTYVLCRMRVLCILRSSS